MTFPRSWWAEKERVFPLRDEATGRQLVDQRPVHLLVEIEIEGIEHAIGIAKARQFVATQEAFRSAVELDGGYAEAHFNLALSLDEAGKYTEAAKELEKAKKLGLKIPVR